LANDRPQRGQVHIGLPALFTPEGPAGTPSRGPASS